MNKITKTMLAVVIVAATAFVANEIVQRSAGTSTIQDNGSIMMFEDTNALVNGAFDTNVESWQLGAGWPVVWSSAEGNGSVQVTATSDSGSSGRGVFSQCTDVSNNQRFELGGSFKKDDRSTQGGGGRIRVSWYEHLDCGGDAEVDANSVSPKNKLGWQQLRASELTAPLKTQSVRVSVIQTVGGPGEFIAYWDNLYLKATQ